MATRVKPATAPTALYFYGVSKKSAGSGKLRGIDVIHTVETEPCAGLVCWFSRVDRGEYGDQLTQNMENLEWLATASVHHQRVVGAIAEQTNILPSRFGTVFLSEASMKRHVEERKRNLSEALARIEGAEEWGVKIFAEASTPPVQETATSGTDYLLKKREILRQRAHPGEPGELPKLKADLAKIASASLDGGRGKAPQPGLVWQASYLVKAAQTKKFHAALQKYAAAMQHARIETTGPWPPYSFANPSAAPDASNERKGARPARTARSRARK